MEKRCSETDSSAATADRVNSDGGTAKMPGPVDENVASLPIDQTLSDFKTFDSSAADPLDQTISNFKTEDSGLQGDSNPLDLDMTISDAQTISSASEVTNGQMGSQPAGSADRQPGDLEQKTAPQVEKLLEENARDNQYGIIDKRYLLTGKLGEGGAGSVYRARDLIAGNEVAIKTLPSRITRNPETIQNIRDNFLLVSQLNHHNIANVRHLHNVVELTPGMQASDFAVGDYVLVMDLVQGMTLSQYRKNHPDGKLAFEEVIEIGRQIALVLDYAHSQNIIHRDIKPGNIMVQRTTKSNAGPKENLEIKVLDFGLATTADKYSSEITSNPANIAGTLPYMALEQWTGRSLDSRTDQYALAVVCYELLGGQVPYQHVFLSVDKREMLEAITNSAPEPISGLSPRANRILARGLARTPSLRFESCTIFIEELLKAENPTAADLLTDDQRQRLEDLGYGAEDVAAVASLGYSLMMDDDYLEMNRFDPPDEDSPYITDQIFDVAVNKFKSSKVKLNRQRMILKIFPFIVIALGLVIAYFYRVMDRVPYKETKVNIPACRNGEGDMTVFTGLGNSYFKYSEAPSYGLDSININNMYLYYFFDLKNFNQGHHDVLLTIRDADNAVVKKFNYSFSHDLTNRWIYFPMTKQQRVKLGQWKAELRIDGTPVVENSFYAYSSVFSRTMLAALIVLLSIVVAFAPRMFGIEERLVENYSKLFKAAHTAAA